MNNKRVTVNTGVFQCKVDDWNALDRKVRELRRALRSINNRTSPENANDSMDTFDLLALIDTVYCITNTALSQNTIE